MSETKTVKELVEEKRRGLSKYDLELRNEAEWFLGDYYYFTTVLRADTREELIEALENKIAKFEHVVSHLK